MPKKSGTRTKILAVPCPKRYSVNGVQNWKMSRAYTSGCRPWSKNVSCLNSLSERYNEFVEMILNVGVSAQILQYIKSWNFLFMFLWGSGFWDFYSCAIYTPYLQVGYIILPLSLDQLSWNSYQQVSHVYTHRFVPQRHCKEHERRINKRNRRCVVRYTRRFISQSSLRRKSVCVNVALHVYFEAVQILIKVSQSSWEVWSRLNY